jgi:hypothetical protein
MTKHLFFKFVHRAIEWLFRPRTLASLLLKNGVVLMVVALGFDIGAQADFKGVSNAWSFRIASGEGPPKWAMLGAYGIGCMLAILGIIVAIQRAWADIKKEARQKLIIVELRGLHSSPDSPAKGAELGEYIGQKEWVQVDFRPQGNDALVDPDLALTKISGIKTTVEILAAGRDKADIQLAIGGLAAVPALFLAGMLVDDETNVTLYDWDRNAKLWRLVDGSDDRKRFELLDGAEVDAGTKEVVLAVSVSYPIDTQALRQTFGASMPIARLTSEEVLADRYWSEEKQQAYVVSLRDAIQKLMSVGVQRIHMVLAAPASLSIRMGMAYDRRLMPNLIVYQYEKTATPPYPWGIQMPTHGHTPAKVVWSDSEQFALAPRCS